MSEIIQNISDIFFFTSGKRIFYKYTEKGKAIQKQKAVLRNRREHGLFVFIKQVYLNAQKQNQYLRA